MADAHESRNFMLHYYLVLYGILYYDYLSMLNKEYRTIWKAKWTVVKILYLVNRYLMLIIPIIILVGFRLEWTTERCQSRYIPWQTLLPVVVAAAGSIILLLRTYIIWGQERWVLYVLVPLLVAHLGTSTALAATHVSALPFPGGVGPCMVRAKNAVMDLYCILPMIFDLTTSGLCVYKSFKMQREAGNYASSLLRNFTKHGTLYAVGAAIANISNLAFMAITSKQLGLPTVPSNGGMLCTVFSSIFISRLAMSLKDEDQNRRKAGEGMIPLSSVHSSSTKLDFKGGRDSNLSGATFVNIPSLVETRRGSDFSVSSKKSVAPSYTVATQGPAKEPQVNYTNRVDQTVERPEDDVQWASYDPGSFSVVHVQTAPPGHKASRRASDLPHPAQSTAYEVAAERMPATMKRISSKAPLEPITELSPVTSDGSFMQRAVMVSPYVYDHVPPNTAHSNEVSPTEGYWLGAVVAESPIDAHHRNARPPSSRMSPATSPIYAQFPLDDNNTPSTGEIFVTAPTPAASNMYSPQPESARSRYAVTRVPAPSPSSPRSFAAARASARRVSWIQDVGAKMQRMQT